MLKTIWRWLQARAAEKSTIAGVLTIAATVASTVGQPKVASVIRVVGAVVGGGLVAATTTPAAPADASLAGAAG